MTWTATQEAVRLAISQASQLTDVAGISGDAVHLVEWVSRASAARTSDGPMIDLRMTRVRGYGQDETRRTASAEVDPVDASLTTYRGGMREFTVEVMIDVDTQEPGYESVAELSDKLRRRILFETPTATLRAAGVAYISQGTAPTSEADYEGLDGRVMSRAMTELRFRTTVNEIDTDATAFVAYVSGTLDVEGVDGVDIEIPVTNVP